MFSTSGKYERFGASRDQATSGLLPETFSFDQNYPNPFNPSTSFNFALPAPVHVKLEIFNILGQKVATVTNEEYPAGHHILDWDGRSNSRPVASGVYMARIVAGENTATKKMVVMK